VTYIKLIYNEVDQRNMVLTYHDTHVQRSKLDNKQPLPWENQATGYAFVELSTN